MNLVLLSPSWLVALLMLTLAIAAVEDAIRLRISNLTCAVVLCGAIGAIALHGLRFDLWQNALVFAVILAVGTAAFGAGWLGGGDVKLLAALGLWLDLGTGLTVVAAIAVTGGVLALIYIGARRLRRSPSSSVRGSSVPYGLAIVGGALFVLGTQMMHRPGSPLMKRAGVIGAHYYSQIPASQVR